MVSTVNNCTAYLKAAKSLDLKSSHLTHTNTQNSKIMYGNRR